MYNNNKQSEHSSVIAGEAYRVCSTHHCLGWKWVLAFSQLKLLQ